MSNAHWTQPPTGEYQHRDSALAWFEFGFKVIPIEQKKTVVKWDDWLDRLSESRIRNHWDFNVEHEVGCILEEGYIVLDADTPASLDALKRIEAEHAVSPALVVTTKKGEHHYFKLATGVVTKNDGHDTNIYPERIDVKTRRGMVVLPWSAGKQTQHLSVAHASELTEVDEAFVKAIRHHNGRDLEPPKPTPTHKPAYVSDHSAEPQLATTDVAELTRLVNQLSPNLGYEDWVHVLMAVYHETQGSDQGFAVIDEWSSRGDSYPGTDMLRIKWQSFKANTGRPITVGTLRSLVKLAGGQAFEEFTYQVETQVVLPEEKTNKTAVAENQYADQPKNPLDSHAIDEQELEKMRETAKEQVNVLGELALLGQSTVFYAAPNTGKTLISLHLLIRSIEQGVISPEDVYYLNMDDNHSGLINKVQLSQTYGFKMLAPGHKKFKADSLTEKMKTMVKNNMANGVVIILDTLKKFTDLMDKRSSSEFAERTREFVMKGGTVIALAHTNKNKDKSGKTVHAGTSDIVEDFDCAYLIETKDLADEIDAQESAYQYAEFINIKRRGCVAVSAHYRYSTQRDLSYEQLLASVEQVSDEQARTINTEVQRQIDAPLIAEISQAIAQGTSQKMNLVKCVCEITNSSRQSVIQVVERYTDQLWSKTIGARGVHNYALISINN